MCADNVTFAQADTILVRQAKQYLDKDVVLKGKLMGIKPYTDRNGKEIMFLDIDTTYPNTEVGITIFPDALVELKITADYIGREIFISGFLTDYRGKPSITVQEANQLTFGK